MTQRTRRITEGASTVLLIILLLVLSYIPLIGSFSFFFLPVPMAYFASRQGFKASLLVYLCSFIVGILVVQLVLACVAMGFLLAGIVMGVLLFKKASVWQLLVGASLSNIVVLLVGYGVATLLFHINPVSWMTNYMQRILDTSFSSLFVGHTQSMQNFKNAIKSIGSLAPAFLVTSAIFYAFIVQSIAGAVLRRLRTPFPKWPPFREWRFPRQLMWYFVIALILEMFTGGSQGKQGWSVIVFNVLYLMEWVTVIQGLSFVYFFFHQRGQRVIFPILITLFSLLVPVVLYIVRILGIIDLGFDFRSRIGKK